jgi:hypothetical protein
MDRGENMVLKLWNPYMIWSILLLHGITRLMYISYLQSLKIIMLTTLYISKGLRNSFVIIILYVDIILVSNDFILLKETKNNLFKKFEIVDLGEIQCFLGIQVNCV